jgi:hypothetical protein
VNHKGNIKFTKPPNVVRSISNKGKRIKIRGEKRSQRILISNDNATKEDLQQIFFSFILF